MTTARILFFTLLATLALQSKGVAQLPPMPPAPTSLVGHHDIKNMDGTPVVPGHTASIEVSVQGGVMIGVVRLDGVAIPSQTTTFELVNGDPLLYTFTNVAGNSGFCAWNPASQQFENLTVTGPGSGNTRALCPR